MPAEELDRRIKKPEKDARALKRSYFTRHLTEERALKKEKLKEMLKKKDSRTAREVQELIEAESGVSYSSWKSMLSYPRT